MMDDDSPILFETVDALLRTKKYRRISRDLLERLAAEELAKRRSPKEALKTLKRRLHEIYGAFVSDASFGDANRLLDELERSGRSPSEIRACAAKLLALHASTAERLPDYPRFYADVFGITGKPRVILDVACGFHPFSIPLMGGNVPERYVASEIDVETVALLNRFLPLVGLDPLATARDSIASSLEDEGDVAFFLKSMPTFERQQKGAGIRLIAELRARWVVVSFATRSLGGKSKGMSVHYAATYGAELERAFRVAGRLETFTELIYVLEKESENHESDAE